MKNRVQEGLERGGGRKEKSFKMLRMERWQEDDRRTRLLAGTEPMWLLSVWRRHKGKANGSIFYPNLEKFHPFQDYL